jgi:peptidoglycan/xylan/chitin deacetylase (PgdA/CDA1 family)
MQPFSVMPETFRRHLDAIVESESTSLTVSELVIGRQAGTLPERPVVITFDDGSADFADEALPALAARGLACTLYVTTGFLEGSPQPVTARPFGPMLHWRQLGELRRDRLEIGAHSHSHPQLDQLSAAALRDELTRSRGLLEDRVGRLVTTLAYPYGYSSARVRREVGAAGYEIAAAVANRMSAAGGDDALAIPRLTVRSSTSLATFERIAGGRDIPLIFLKDRALTKGYAAVRRTRYGMRRVMGHV